MRSLFVVPPLLALFGAVMLCLALRQAMQRRSQQAERQRALLLLSEFGHATKTVRARIATPRICKRRWQHTALAEQTETQPRYSEDALRSTLYMAMAKWIRWQAVRSKE